MNDELRRHLDGELARADLPPEARGEAEAWDRLVAGFRVEAPTGSAPPWLEQKVMAEIDALPEPNPIRRAWDWVVRPRPVRVSPLAGALAVAGLAAVFILSQSPPVGVSAPGAVGGGPIDMASSGGDEQAAVVYVQFRLAAPGARSVSLAGDFSDWQASVELEDGDQDGVWTARVPVEPGVHAYMFLIDGTEWATDPEANRYQDDGFGNRNAILAVAASD